MRKSIIFCIFFTLAVAFINSQGIQVLSEKIHNNITDFFKEMRGVNYSIIKFEDSFKFTDLELQRFYNLIVTKLEESDKDHFFDLATGFNNGRGNFNLNRISRINYYITIKIINNMGNLGAGILIYNRNLERVVSVKYVEVSVDKNEIEILSTKDPGLANREYLKMNDIRISGNLLSVDSFLIDGTDNIFFLFPERIDVYTLENNTIKKINSVKIRWGRPFYPSIEMEGNIFVYSENSQIYVFAGSNFSKYSHVFKFNENKLGQLSKLDFSVFDIVSINGKIYMAGFNYDFGKNFYNGKLYLKSFNASNLSSGEIFIKKIPDFYSASFYKKGVNFQALFLIDKNYNMRIFTDKVSDSKRIDRKYGSAIAVLNDLIVVSDFSKANDRIKVLGINADSSTPIFDKEIFGSIKFIKEGKVGKYKGFWMLVKNNGEVSEKSKLQFWRKDIE